MLQHVRMRKLWQMLYTNAEDELRNTAAIAAQVVIWKTTDW
jgi:hypothetical protein